MQSNIIKPELKEVRIRKKEAKIRRKIIDQCLWEKQHKLRFDKKSWSFDLRACSSDFYLWQVHRYRASKSDELTQPFVNDVALE